MRSQTAEARLKSGLEFHTSIWGRTNADSEVIRVDYIVYYTYNARSGLASSSKSTALLNGWWTGSPIFIRIVSKTEVTPHGVYKSEGINTYILDMGTHTVKHASNTALFRGPNFPDFGLFLQDARYHVGRFRTVRAGAGTELCIVLTAWSLELAISSTNNTHKNPTTTNEKSPLGKKCSNNCIKPWSPAK